MTEPNPPENLDTGNERALRKLAWAIEASQGQFKLILARCNYTGVRGRLVRRLQQQVRGKIRILELQASDRNLYGRIQAELGANVPAALTVFGLEAVGDIDLLLTSTNQVREEFQKHFHFPLVVWVTDEVLKKLLRVAPDFESWAITVEFAITGEDVANFVREIAERWFANTLKLTRQGCLELQAAEKDLLGGGEGLDSELEANLESLIGTVKFMYNETDAALEHYQKALELWRETGNLDRQAKLVSEIALCYSLKADRGEINLSDRQGIGDFLRENLDVFERAERPDLVAISILLVCRILREFEEWEGLRALAEKALQLHDRENMPVELAQDFGFLAEAALGEKRWGEARDFAERARQVLGYDLGQGEGQGEGQAGRLSYASRYLFILAQAQENLNQFDEAIRSLESAKKDGSPEYDTQLYLDILRRLHELYFAGKKYLEAFKIKLERLSVEQQYGLRAFVGAGRIQPQRQAKFALTPVVERGVAPQQENVAPEIAASGRMLDVERLIEEIGRYDKKLIVIHGQSGVGKSSLVNGGLVPALKETVIGIKGEAVLPVSVRVYTSWVAELGRALAEAMAEKGAGAGALESGTPPPNPLPARGEGEQDSRMDYVGGNVLHSVKAILKQLRQNKKRDWWTVLIFDQFEEFFFVCTSPAQRRLFFNILGKCMKRLSVKVILSLREDYLHYLLECNRLKSMNSIGNDILSNNVLYHLGNFSPEDAKSVVRRLTERSNFHPEGDLIEELVRDLAGELGEVRPIELQVVGAQLQAEKITTLALYRERGPKAEFVKRYLEEVVRDCGADNKQAAEFVLYLLTDEKGTRPLKTRAELERDLQVLAAELAGEASRLDLVLEIFVGSGMVLLLPESPAARYQLVHDYLAALIREQQQTKFNELIAELKKEREQRQLAEALREKDSQNFKEMQELITLERDGVNALREYEFRQIEALLSAMQAGQKLQTLDKDKPHLKEYPIATPILALQTVLDSIWERNQLKGHQDRVCSASFSPDGKRIVTASWDRTARVWDSTTGKQLHELKGHQDIVWSASFSPDGNYIVTASSDRTARVWDSTGKLLHQLKGHRGGVRSASFSPDGERIVTASYDNTVRVWDSTGNQLHELKGHQDAVNSASFSPDGERIVTASSDKTARVWDSTTGKRLHELKGHQDAVNSASFSPDGNYIVTASSDRTARVWDSTGNQRHELTEHQGAVWSASFSLKGNYIVTASDDGTARVWDSTGKQLYELKGHQRAVNSASFSPDGKRIVTASYDKTARVWDRTGNQLHELKGHQDAVNSASFSPDGQRIVTASSDKTARVWDSTTGKQRHELKGHQDAVISASFSPDKNYIYIVTASSDRTARVWDSTTGKQLYELTGHQNRVCSASFSPDKKRIVTASWDRTARVWDSTTGKQLHELKGHQGTVRNANFSSDGKRIVTASFDRTARVWDSTGNLLLKLKGHQGYVLSASFSPDGKRIVTASSDRTARVWDSTTGELRYEFKGHQHTVNSASFSPDGNYIVTASSDRTARVWDSTGNQLYELKGHQHTFWNASFSPDGKWVVTASSDRTALVWRVYSLDELLARGCNWLNDYLITHPKDLEKLEVCQTQSNRLEAAPFLVKEGEEEARGGNVDEAVATFRTALKWNPSLTLNPETKAKQLAEASDLVKKGELLAEKGNIEGAVAEFQKALQLDPDFEPAPVLVTAGEALVKEGKVKEAIAAYAQAQKFDPKFDIFADSWDTLCRYGSLHRHAEDVMFACEKAVALAPYNERYRDSRGIARALTGKTKGAIEDFQAYIAWIDNLPSGSKDDYKEGKSQRQRWVDALKAGNNPFTDEELKRLLGE